MALSALPNELRLKVWKYLLAPESEDEPCGQLDLSLKLVPTPWEHWYGGRPDLAILSTCRQFYLEGNAILFEHRTFFITEFDRYSRADKDNGPFLGSLRLQIALAQNPHFAKIRKICIKLFVPTGSDNHTSRFSVRSSVQSLLVVPWCLSKICGRFKGIVVVLQSGRGWPPKRSKYPRGRLNRFGILRADSVEFWGFESQHLQPLMNHMQSQAPVHDLNNDLFEVGGLLLVIRWIWTQREETNREENDPHRSCPIANHGELVDLLYATLEWNVHRFQKAEEQLLRAVQTQLQEWQLEVEDKIGTQLLIEETEELLARHARQFAWSHDVRNCGQRSPTQYVDDTRIAARCRHSFDHLHLRRWCFCHLEHEWMGLYHYRFEGMYRRDRTLVTIDQITH